MHLRYSLNMVYNSFQFHHLPFRNDFDDLCWHFLYLLSLDSLNLYSNNFNWYNHKLLNYHRHVYPTNNFFDNFLHQRNNFLDSANDFHWYLPLHNNFSNDLHFLDDFLSFDHSHNLLYDFLNFHWHLLNLHYRY
jgi:hypothetical protein